MAVTVGTYWSSGVSAWEYTHLRPGPHDVTSRIVKLGFIAIIIAAQNHPVLICSSQRLKPFHQRRVPKPNKHDRRTQGTSARPTGSI
jgi:hypothetical protein